MLTVSFASGASTRVPFNPEMTVKDLLESLRNDEKAADPAPGRDRAYLAAAVNSAALAQAQQGNTTGSKGSGDTAAAAAATSSMSADESSSPLTAGEGAEASSLANPTAVLVGKAFVGDKPFPPRQLCDEDTLEASKVTADSAIYVTFLAPIQLVDPSAAKTGSAMPKRFLPCSEVPRDDDNRLYRSMVVYCDGRCGRGKDTVVVEGGAGEVYSVGSQSVCAAAVHAGALDRIMPGAFTVVVASKTREQVPCLGEKNGVQSRPAFGTTKVFTVAKYTEGDEDAYMRPEDD